MQPGYHRTRPTSEHRGVQNDGMFAALWGLRVTNTAISFHIAMLSIEQFRSHVWNVSWVSELSGLPTVFS
jgi:hypothetical protein